MKLYYDKPETLSAAISGERRGVVNREILFRGKRADTKEWIYGDVQQNVDAVKIREQEQSIQRIAKSFVVIPETVGQYTGLTDIHGVKIFEGDIIEAHFDELFPDLATLVVWSDYGWFGRDMEGNVDSLERKWVSDFFEIIGNIHDNPELLEVSGNNG
jgi:uncharacterized phage protein (TIGR01671 family)